MKSIIFDFGGVLLDWNPDHFYRSYFEKEADMHRFYNETEIKVHNVDLDRGIPFDILLNKLKDKHPQHREALQLWKDAWHKMLGDRIEGSILLLHELHELGYPLYGLTNWSAETFPYVFYTHDFFRVFRDIVVSGREDCVKPERKIFDICLQRNSLQAEQCIFIDDNFENIKAAQALGIAGIHFKEPAQLRSALKSHQIKLR